jgi:GTPase SAR1 family protein
VYDVSVADTFKRVQKWAAELKTFNKNTIIAVAGNKIDLKTHFENEKEIAQKYVKDENLKHFYTSAKTGEGLDEIFEYITKEIADKNLNKNSGHSSIKSGVKKLQVKKGGSIDATQKDAGCCK